MRTFRFLISCLLISDLRRLRREKTSFASNASGDLSGQAPNPRLVARRVESKAKRLTQARPHGPSCNASPHSALDRMRFLFTMSDIGRARRFRRAALRQRFSTRSRASTNELIKLHRIGNGRPPATAPNSCPAVALQNWWSQTGSNRRPHACKARALPTELWPRRREAAK
jgi:hypothetical protein